MKSKKIEIKNIPRTIFGTTYTYIKKDYIIKNNIIIYQSEKERNNQIKFLELFPNRFQDIKRIKWIIKV